MSSLIDQLVSYGALIGCYPVELCDELGEEGGHYAGDVDEGPLFPQRHPRAQGRRQTHRLGDEGPEVSWLIIIIYSEGANEKL